jgi:RimJ/RimL family protein N-acetyltransferase
VEIGYTFLTRPYWGGAFNRELKTLMLNYTFQFVDTVYFVVGENNLRSRKAMKKIGAVEVSNSALTPVSGDLTHNVIFEIKKSDWQKQPHILPKFNQHPLDTFGLKLEPVTEAHTQGHKQR